MPLTTIPLLIANTDVQVIAGFSTTSFNPADATTYYYGLGASPGTATDLHKIRIRKASTIISATVNVIVVGTLGSAETSTHFIRLNDTTDTTISTAFQYDMLVETFQNTALSIGVVPGDYVEFKTVTPTWVTNPTTVFFAWQLMLERS